MVLGIFLILPELDDGTTLGLFPHVTRPCQRNSTPAARSFGSDTSFMAAAIETVRYNGGLLYLTSTDGFCSGGRRPERSLAAFGAYLRCAREWTAGGTGHAQGCSSLVVG